MNIPRLIAVFAMPCLFGILPAFASAEAVALSGAESIATLPLTTATVVRVWGRSPNLGEFTQTNAAVDLTTAIQTQLGPLATSGSLVGGWTGWREETDTTGGVVLIFVGPEEGLDPVLLKKSYASGLSGGAKVVVMPAQPGMRLSDIFRIRRTLSELKVDFVDLGAVAGGRPFEEALTEVARILKSPRTIPSANLAPDEAGFAEQLPNRQISPLSPPTQAGRNSKPFTTEVQNGERVIYMNPPPAVRDFPRTRPVARDPSQKKMPALSN